jgi:hypothetical protein
MFNPKEFSWENNRRLCKEYEHYQLSDACMLVSE